MSLSVNYGKPRSAIVTGGNRGLGFEICRQLAVQGIRVVLTARDTEQGQAAANALRDTGADVVFQTLDISDQASIARCLATEFWGQQGVDILINNAGIYLDQGVSVMDTQTAFLTQAIATDVCGAFSLSRGLIPGMRERGYGRIVNISSRTSRLDQMDNTGLSYKMAKASLNVLTVVLAQEVKADNILINAVNPGWLHTGMGGEQAPVSAATGAEGPVWLATLPDDGPSGKFFHAQKHIPW